MSRRPGQILLASLFLWGLGDAAELRTTAQITEADRQWWSFRPLNAAATPAGGAGEGGPSIDRLLRARFEREGRRYGPEADRPALLRRLTFDLTGLPPTPAELDAFAADTSAHAFENAVERLLQSPHFGERQARFWLDLVRFAESDGYKQDALRPDAWRFRDYVIDAFNADKPYDRFIQEQLAGDELFPDDPQALVATGFYRACVYEYNNRDARTQWSNILAETTDTVGDVFLGVGLQCARCHNHKFDPILQEDYYRLQACFAGLRWRDDRFATSEREVAAYQEKLAEWERAQAPLIEELAAFERPFREKVESEMLEKFPRDLEETFRRDPATWTPLERQLMYIVRRQVREEHAPIESKMKGDEKRRWKEIKARMAEAEKTRPPSPGRAFGVGDVGPEKPPTVFSGRKDPVEAGFPLVLGGGAAGEPHRRSALARWLTDPEHPLTARVIVNRLWQQHFGRGLTDTPSDFGHLGERPTDPELLDWLAHELVTNRWRLKALHRLMVTSEFYRCGGVVSGNAAADAPPVPAAISPRRLQAEQIRDAALAASGELDPSAHGPSVSSDTGRRTVYTVARRNTPDPLLASFDAPDTFRSAAARPTTTTATQSLLLINGQWMQQRARAMARMLMTAFPDQRARQIREIYRRAMSREPDATEIAQGLAFIRYQRERAEQEALPALPEAAFAESRDLPRHGMSLVVTPSNARHRLFPTMNRRDAALEELTAEAVICLHSLWDDGSVRTIVSRWDGENDHHGWSLGVTGKQSRYTPGTLIFQLVGEGPDGETLAEVAASDLAVPVGRPWFAAASLAPGSVTFAVKDLGDDDAELRKVTVPIQVRSLRPPGNVPVTFGARSDVTRTHFFDGLIGEARLTSRALAPEQLLCLATGQPEGVIGHWKFDMDHGPLADTSPAGQALEIPRPPDRPDASLSALGDFCHVVLNSSEFLYVE